jgi:transcriptional regulator with XRE-family HTH domain
MSAGGATYRKTNPAQVADEAERCFELKAKGWTVRRIADEVGLSSATVQRRITNACERRVSPKVEHYRAVQDETLDAAQQVVQDIIENATDYELKLKAVDRLGRILERRARLRGLDAPVRVDTAVTQQPQTEAELEALLAAQDARNKPLRP